LSATVPNTTAPCSCGVEESQLSGLDFVFFVHSLAAQAVAAGTPLPDNGVPGAAGLVRPVWGIGFRDYGSGVRVQGSKCKVWDSGFMVWGLEFGVYVLGLKVIFRGVGQGLGFMAYGVGCVGFRDQGCKKHLGIGALRQENPNPTTLTPRLCKVSGSGA